MILRILAIPVIAAAVSGCAGLDMPEPASESWALARIAADETGAAPAFVPERVLDRGTLAAMAASERALLVRGAQIREAAASVPDPEEPADAYAVRQRARATPPQ